MDYKQIAFYVITFIIGFAIGKVLKINVTGKTGCPIARKTLEQLKYKMNSENSENYL